MRQKRRKSVLPFVSTAAFALAVGMWGLSPWWEDVVTLSTPYYITSVHSRDGGIFVSRLLLDFTQPEWETEHMNHSNTGWHWSVDHLRSGPRYGTFEGWVSSQPDVSDEPVGAGGFYLYPNGYPVKFAPNMSILPPPMAEGWMIRFPWWSIIVLTGILPAKHLIRLTTRVRPHRKGYCRNCGYDLRATPDRCPECGLAAEQKM
jgi:hypothetical protein